MEFQWDRKKRSANRLKHNVDFVDAVGVFYDDRALTREDPDAEGEPRFITLGMDFRTRLLLVVHAEQGEEVIRIISARRASPGESRAYHEES